MAEQREGRRGSPVGGRWAGAIHGGPLLLFHPRTGSYIGPLGSLMSHVGSVCQKEAERQQRRKTRRRVIMSALCVIMSALCTSTVHARTPCTVSEPSTVARERTVHARTPWRTRCSEPHVAGCQEKHRVHHKVRLAS